MEHPSTGRGARGHKHLALVRNSDASHEERAALRRWYAAVSSGWEQQLEIVRRRSFGKSVLEYGCADGRLALVEQRIAQQSARFCGIDLSAPAIAQARGTARTLGVRHCRFDAMDAQALTFPDNHFDLVFGRGIIHHLEPERSFAEIQRVLRRGGTAVFYEPMGHNPWLNRLRARAAELRAVRERRLVDDDFRLARRLFRSVETRFYGLTTFAPAALAESNPLRVQLLRVCRHIDDWLLRWPWLGRNASFVLLTVTK